MKVTAQALEQLNEAVTQYNVPGAGVRIFSAQGCCGPALQMSIEDHLSADDKMLTIENVDFFIESQAEQMLSDITIDFRENSFKLDGMKRSGGCCG